MKTLTFLKYSKEYVHLTKCITLIVCCILFIGTANPASAQITAGFELDGNATAVLPNPPDDWDLIYNHTSSAAVTTGVVTDLPSNADNYFVQGSQDIDDVSQWHWSVNSTPDKDDILNAGAALYGS